MSGSGLCLVLGVECIAADWLYVDLDPHKLQLNYSSSRGYSAPGNNSLQSQRKLAALTPDSVVLVLENHPKGSQGMATR